MESVLPLITVKPLGDRVLVQPVEAEESTGRIIIPDAAKEKPVEGIVIEVGPGKLDDTGKRQILDVKKGDRVICPKYGGTDIKFNGIEYKIWSFDDIIAIVEKL